MRMPWWLTDRTVPWPEKGDRALEETSLWLGRHLPTRLRYWTVVAVAVKTRDTYPGDVTATDMLKHLRPEGR